MTEALLGDRALACRDVPGQRIHLFEPTGFGGIFQHACALAQLLSRSDITVTLHTSAQHEAVDLEGVSVCPCVWWPHGGRSTRRRRLKIAARLLARGLPHLHRAAARGDVVHVQGGTASGVLAAATLFAAGRRGRHVVYSPHNVFSRGGRVDGAMQKLCLRLSDVAIAYSQQDVAILESRGVRARFSPLIQLVPSPSQEALSAWRERWNANQVVLFAGQVRPDKRLDLLVESASQWPDGRRLAVVGEDRGAWESCTALAELRGVEMQGAIGFQPLEDFTAAIAAADVLVAPYDRASQSGILSIARQLGVRTVASGVGGLAELADRTFPPGDVAALGAAIDAELSAVQPPPRPHDEEDALQAHRAAYADRDVSGRRGPAA